jgi:hypothetical protein
MIAAMSMFFLYAFSSDNAKHLRIIGRQMQDEPLQPMSKLTSGFHFVAKTFITVVETRAVTCDSDRPARRSVCAELLGLLGMIGAYQYCLMR